MPFQKGNKLAVGSKGGGRKGYEFEKTQIKRMITLLNRYLTLAEIIGKGKSTANQDKAFESLKALILKIMDKLHANKTAVDITGNLQYEDINKNTEMIKYLIAKYKDDGKTKTTLPRSS